MNHYKDMYPARFNKLDKHKEAKNSFTRAEAWWVLVSETSPADLAHCLWTENLSWTPLLTIGWFSSRVQPKILTQTPTWTSNICALTESKERRENNFYLCVLYPRSDQRCILFQLWISFSWQFQPLNTSENLAEGRVSFLKWDSDQ